MKVVRKVNYPSLCKKDDRSSPSHRHFSASCAMYSRSTIPSTSSMLDKFDMDKTVESLCSEDSPLLAAFNCELKDLLSIDDSAGSDCLDIEGAPAKAAG